MRLRLHPLLQAGLALGIAGAGRITFQSVVSLGFGAELWGRTSVLLTGVMLVGGVAAAGPYGAVTLGVARKWAERPGRLPRAYAVLLGKAALVFIATLVPLGHYTLGGGATPALWLTAAIVYAVYQILRAAGYAVQRAGAVTLAEVIGALAPLALLPIVARAGLVGDPRWLVAIYTLGPVAFLVVLSVLLGGRVRLSDEEVTPEERRRVIRESSVFALGAGSATAMQFLAPTLAGKLDAPAVAAILFGSLNATAPLLVLSRVYTTVMLPALAAGDEAAGGVEDHARTLEALFFPSLAMAFGAAPWIPLSLGVEISPFTVATAALIGVVTLGQVWATPAVTILSARHRELVPALSSAGGLAVAGVIWWAALVREDPSLLPVGLAAGSVVRSLVPAWIGGGLRRGTFGLAVVPKVLLAAGLCGVVLACGRLEPIPSLALGAAVALGGALAAARVFLRARAAAGAAR